MPVRIGGSGKLKRTIGKDNSLDYLVRAIRLQGLPEDFDLPGFTVHAKVRAVGNGVPLPMGRAIAKAVKAALAREAA